MKTEPGIDPKALLAHLNRHYDVNVSGARFVPAGEGAWCYQVTGERLLFARLAKRPVPEAALALMQHLCRLQFPVIPLIATRSGEPASVFDGLQLTLQSWFQGSSVMRLDTDTTRLHERIGAHTARLHATVVSVDLPFEDFTRYQPDVRSVMDAHADGAFLALREAMRVEIELVLQAAETEGARLRAGGFEAVVCHGDLHDDNVLVAEDGDIRIVDWDGAMLAPRERDLMFFMGGDWDDYLKGYDSGASFQANQDLLDYYTLEWALQEIFDYGSRILFDDRFDATGKADALHRFRALFETDQDVDRAVQLIRRRGR